MDAGDLLTRWTVRLAMGLYVTALSLRWTAKGRATRLTTARWAWTGGCLLLLGHVMCAFAYFHDWSNAAAYQETARRTAEMVGVAWGGGLYLNYAFTAVWLADVAWWWLWPASYQQRGPAVEWPIQAFMGFIAFNGVVVFADWPIRVAGLVACAVLLIAWATSRTRN